MHICDSEVTLCVALSPARSPAAPESAMSAFTSLPRHKETVLRCAKPSLVEKSAINHHSPLTTCSGTHQNGNAGSVGG